METKSSSSLTFYLKELTEVISSKIWKIWSWRKWIRATLQRWDLISYNMLLFKSILESNKDLRIEQGVIHNGVEIKIVLLDYAGQGKVLGRPRPKTGLGRTPQWGRVTTPFQMSFLRYLLNTFLFQWNILRISDQRRVRVLRRVHRLPFEFPYGMGLYLVLEWNEFSP